MFSNVKACAGYAGAILCTCLSIPFACLGVGFLVWDTVVTNPRKAKKQNQEYNSISATTLAGTETRRRPLTPDQPNAKPVRKYGQTTKPPTQSQIESQSWFLSLPYEIRLMIYKELLPGSRISLITYPILDPSIDPKKRRTRHPPLKIGNYICKNACLSLPTPIPGSCHPSCPPQGHRSLNGIISLLQTNRQIYNELLPLLYTSHTFSLAYFTAEPWTRVWETGRFTLLRNLEIAFSLHPKPHDIMSPACEFPRVARAWKKTWLTLATLKQLRQLAIWIRKADGLGSGWQLGYTADVEGTWMAWQERQICCFAKQLVLREKWDLWLGWQGLEGYRVDEDESGHGWEEMGNPFVVRRFDGSDVH